MYSPTFHRAGSCLQCSQTKKVGSIKQCPLYPVPRLYSHHDGRLLDLRHCLNQLLVLSGQICTYGFSIYTATIWRTLRYRE